jgi:hypothetical protein
MGRYVFTVSTGSSTDGETIDGAYAGLRVARAYVRRVYGVEVDQVRTGVWFGRRAAGDCVWIRRFYVRYSARWA